MDKLKFAVGCLTLWCCSFKAPSVRYIYLAEYSTYIRLYNCSDTVIDKSISKRKLVIIPKDNCNSLYIKCYRMPGNFLFEEGCYKLDSTVKDVKVNTSNDNSETINVRSYYTPKRTGKWTVYKNGKRTVVNY